LAVNVVLDEIPEKTRDRTIATDERRPGPDVATSRLGSTTALLGADLKVDPVELG
jgi:hypothetical protein